MHGSVSQVGLCPAFCRSLTDGPEKGEGTSFVLSHKFALVAECSFFSLQQHSHSLSKCRPEFSVGSVTVCLCMGAWED